MRVPQPEGWGEENNTLAPSELLETFSPCSVAHRLVIDPCLHHDVVQGSVSVGHANCEETQEKSVLQAISCDMSELSEMITAAIRFSMIDVMKSVPREWKNSEREEERDQGRQRGHTNVLLTG